MFQRRSLETTECDVGAGLLAQGKGILPMLHLARAVATNKQDETKVSICTMYTMSACMLSLEKKPHQGGTFHFCSLILLAQSAESIQWHWKYWCIFV